MQSIQASLGAYATKDEITAAIPTVDLTPYRTNDDLEYGIVKDLQYHMYDLAEGYPNSGVIIDEDISVTKFHIKCNVVYRDFELDIDATSMKLIPLYDVYNMTVRIDSSDDKIHLDFRGDIGIPITELIIYSLTTKETKHLALSEDNYTKSETESLINNVDLTPYRKYDDLKYINEKHLRISDDKLYVLVAYDEGYTYIVKTSNGIEFEYTVDEIKDNYALMRPNNMIIECISPTKEVQLIYWHNLGYSNCNSTFAILFKDFTTYSIDNLEDVYYKIEDDIALKTDIPEAVDLSNYVKRTELDEYATLTKLDEYQLKTNTTTTHYCPIEESMNKIDDFVVGAPVYLIGKVYKYRENEFVPSTENDTTDCICSVKTTGKWNEFVGICTNIDVNNKCIVFASGGDYMLKGTDSSCYGIGDEVFIENGEVKTLTGQTAVTSKIRRTTIGIITSIVNETTLSVFKA